MRQAIESIVVVGASLAGLRTVEGLRAGGYTGSLTLIGSETHAPYDRPPLSKQVLLGRWDAAQNTLRDHAGLAELNVKTLLGRTAVGLRDEHDPGRRAVLLDDGSTVRYDRLVIATGASPRQLPGTDLEGVHTLRTIDDALAIREAFAHSKRVVVVGAGFIGSEVASSARSYGLDVTVVEALPAPLARVVGAEVGEECARLHRAHGVRLICGEGVTALQADTKISAVELTSGLHIPADLVVIGIGVTPTTGWLQGTSLTVDDGVVCNAYGMADPTGSVYAVGDVSRWWHPLLGESLRVEHWTHAAEQAHTVAHNLLAPPSDRRELTSVPYVWSDQYGVKIQITGRISPDNDVTVRRSAGDPDRMIALYSRGGVLTGALAFNQPSQIARCRRLVAARASLQEAAELVGSPS
ncbi:FAD/NAD(P)-binding oxidoreductase [Streptomyces sp. NPDC004542]|uniref:NAD(P)/FAD-dependent oxidoreductase n=1 Tax=Streptomyces sp. NPDC004542 TaxID=3154281 RepID=UPI0033BBBFC9